jgi:hypothetical protein
MKSGGRWRMGRRLRSGLERNLVDLVGIEPTTSSMPWNDENSNLLTAQATKLTWAEG